MGLDFLGSTRFDWVRIPHAGKSSQPLHLECYEILNETVGLKESAGVSEYQFVSEV